MELIHNELYQGVTHAKCKLCPWEMDFIGWSPRNVEEWIDNYKLNHGTQMQCLHEIETTPRILDPCVMCQGAMRITIEGTIYCLNCGHVHHHGARS